MTGSLIFLIGCASFYVAYRWYGRRLDSWFGVNPARPTPAHELHDGVDYVPTRAPVLFGHHFSSIAGAGPIVGPILAGLMFGWLPAFLWILVGAIFVGGVHDYGALVASIRHKGRSLADLCRAYLSPFTYRVFLIFVWFALIYVLIVFMDLTASTFAPPGTGKEALGGTVATASLLYIMIAVVFGFCLYRLRMSFRTATAVFVPLVFAALAVGHLFPLLPSYLPVIAYGSVKYTWTLNLLIYCFLASVLPVWMLLQPRDFLSSFLLFACLILGGLGLFFGGLFGTVTVQYPAFLGLTSKIGPLYPALFITVACGAVSGFHSLVASGTTAKQLETEPAARPIAYGGMLVEGVLALIALGSIMVLARGSGDSKAPATIIFARGIGNFCRTFGIPPSAGERFGLLALSTFLLTTLDTSTRLSRFVLEEFFNVRNPKWRYLTTAGTLLFPAIVVFMRIPDPEHAGKFLPAWKAIWPAFGTTNQLLAALALLVLMVWLRAAKRKTAFLLLPMVFMLITTMYSLVLLIQRHLFEKHGQVVVGVVSAGLLVLAVLVVIDSLVHWVRRAEIEESAPKPA